MLSIVIITYTIKNTVQIRMAPEKVRKMGPTTEEKKLTGTNTPMIKTLGPRGENFYKNDYTDSRIYKKR